MDATMGDIWLRKHPMVDVELMSLKKEKFGMKNVLRT
jgi:hypothetical protein